MGRKFTKIGKRECGEIADLIAEYLEPFEKEHGIRFTVEKRTYFPAGTAIQVVLSGGLIQSDGFVKDRYALEFEANAEKYGLKGSDLGKTFSTQSGRYKIVGLNGKKRKAPIMAVRVEGPDKIGQHFVFPAHVVRFVLEREK